MNCYNFFAILLLCCGAQAGLVFQRQLEGPCPEVTTVESLDVVDVRTL